MREVLLGFSLIFIVYFMESASAWIVCNPPSVFIGNLYANTNIALATTDKVCGALELADPLDASTLPQFRNDSESKKTDRMRFALIVKGNCSLEQKIRNAQSWGFSAAIVYDDEDKEILINMTVNPEGIKVPAVFISKPAGEFLKDKGEKGDCCIYPLPTRKDLKFFVVVPSLLGVAGFLLLVYIFWSDSLDLERQSSVKSVDAKMVEALPRVSFTSTPLSQCSTSDTCAICLEGYKDGEILKVLPCQHDFHSSCVDSWLTKSGTFCPVCKLDMMTKIVYPEVSEQKF